MFVAAPILAQFDPEKETVVEAESSGWVSEEYSLNTTRRANYTHVTISQEDLPS